MLCYAVLCCAMLCWAALCCAVVCCAVLCCAVLCYAMQCYAMLFYAMLRYATLCYAMLRMTDPRQAAHNHAFLIWAWRPLLSTFQQVSHQCSCADVVTCTCSVLVSTSLIWMSLQVHVAAHVRAEASS